MYNLYYEFCNNIPVFHSNFCGKCSGVLESTCMINNEERGCCWYFPKYTLMDIKNILNLPDSSFINSLPLIEGSVVSQYFIEIKGFFDSEHYSNYMNENFSCNQSSFDPKLFFRLCRFWNPEGCTLAFNLRPHPCNLYLCKETIDKCNVDYKKYSDERRDYFSYCNYFNEVLKDNLNANNTDLLTDFDKSLSIINSVEIPSFEPRKLNNILLAS